MVIGTGLAALSFYLGFESFANDTLRTTLTTGGVGGGVGGGIYGNRQQKGIDTKLRKDFINEKRYNRLYMTIERSIGRFSVNRLSFKGASTDIGYLIDLTKSIFTNLFDVHHISLEGSSLTCSAITYTRNRVARESIFTEEEITQLAMGKSHFNSVFSRIIKNVDAHIIKENVVEFLILALILVSRRDGGDCSLNLGDSEALNADQLIENMSIYAVHENSAFKGYFPGLGLRNTKVSSKGFDGIMQIAQVNEVKSLDLSGQALVKDMTAERFENISNNLSKAEKLKEFNIENSGISLDAEYTVKILEALPPSIEKLGLFREEKQDRKTVTKSEHELSKKIVLSSKIEQKLLAVLKKSTTLMSCSLPKEALCSQEIILFNRSLYGKSVEEREVILSDKHAVIEQRAKALLSVG